MIPYRKLGKTGLQISEMGFGSWAIGGHSYGPVQDPESLHALEVALDAGINFIDTADIYGKGHSEALIGQVIQNFPRGKIIIATKAGWDFSHGLIRANFDRSYIVYALEDSLRRLKTDYVDLFQLHNPPKELALNHELFDELKNLQKSGKIHFYGVSVHGPEEALFWMEHSDIQTIQIVFNLLDQRARLELFSMAQKKGIGLIIREPLACGVLTGKYGVDTIFPKDDHRRRWTQEKMILDLEKIEKIKSVIGDTKAALSQLALEFVLSFSEISVVIPGMKNELQVKNNLKAIHEKHLSKEDVAALCRLYDADVIFSSGFYRN